MLNAGIRPRDSWVDRAPSAVGVVPCTRVGSSASEAVPAAKLAVAASPVINSLREEPVAGIFFVIGDLLSSVLRRHRAGYRVQNDREPAS